MDDNYLLYGYEYLWTTQLDEHILVEVSSGRDTGYVIEHIPTNACLIIEDNESYKAVIEKLIEQGIKIINIIK